MLLSNFRRSTLAYNSSLIAQAVKLLDLPVNQELAAAVVEVATEWERAASGGVLYEILNKVEVNAGGTPVPGRNMAMYLTEICGLDSNIMLPFMAEVGNFLNIRSEMAKV